MIKLKLNPKYWIFFFVSFFTFSSTFLHFAGVQSFQLLLPITFVGSVIIVGAAIGISRFNQKEVFVDDNEISKIGNSSKTILYGDITKIKVGSGGFSIYDKSRNPINITTMHTNFEPAKEVLNQKVKSNEGIEITGLNYFINKYLKQ